MAEGVVERVKGPNGEVVEVVVKAPIAEMKIAAQSLGMDVPTEREMTEAAIAVAQEEHDEANLQRTAASTIATVCLALAYMILADRTHELRKRPGIDNEILIPRSVVDFVTEAKLGIAETADRDVILRWRTRAERRIDPEEMRLDG